ncbi:MAG: DNA-binding domain-containing protein [Proteobacteria bacterium]|nr:DNA-binding domain-containing protein [Pseudomonadota bacterium]
MNKWWPTKKSAHSSPEAGVVRASKDAQIDRVWKLTALPRSEFDLTYGALFNNLSKYLAHAPFDDAVFDIERHLQALLNEVIDALRVRQSRIIPKHLPTEDAARVSELMSFALAVVIVADNTARRVGGLSLKSSHTSWCALLDPIPKGAEVVASDSPHPAFGGLLLGVLVGEAGLRWLSQESIVLDEVLRYFSAAPNSELRALTGATVSPVSRPQIEVPPVAIPMPDATQQSGKSSKVKVAQGWLYVSWLRQQLDSKALSPNTASSFIHALEDASAFLVVPEAFEAYAKERGVPIKRVQNQVKRLGLHRIQPHGKDLFRGTVAGRKVQGMIFKDVGSFWSTSPNPSDLVEVRR